MDRPIRPTSDYTWWQILSVAGLLISVAVTVLSEGVATAMRESRPGSVLQFRPHDARALARSADLALVARDRMGSDLAAVRNDARLALTYDASLPGAWRSLAATMPDGSAAQFKLLLFAQQLSRRDALTQLALLQWHVDHGDVAGALIHYDIILRTTTSYDPLLFPILASVKEPAVRQALVARLVVAPWRRRFLAYMVNAAPPNIMQAELLATMRRLGPLADRDIVAAQAASSALAGDYALGLRFYRLIAPDQIANTVRDGQFDASDGVPPFDWALDTDGPLVVNRQTVEGQGRLEMSAERGDGGRAARQLLTLTPGTYRVSAATGPIDGYVAGTPYMSLSCASAATPLATIEGHPAATRIAGDAVVPAGCPVQWLELGMRQDAGGGRSGTTIADVSVAPSVRHPG